MTWIPFMGGFAHVNLREELTNPKLSRRQKKRRAKLLKLLERPVKPGPVMAGWIKMRGVGQAIRRSRK